MKSRIVKPAASFQPPETCTEHEECQAAQTPIEDLRRNALEHYEKVTTLAHEWYSVVPKAINAYFDSQAIASDAATSMRDHCIETVKEYWQRIQGEDDEGMRELLFGALVVKLENMTLEGREKR